MRRKENLHVVKLFSQHRGFSPRFVQFALQRPSPRLHHSHCILTLLNDGVAASQLFCVRCNRFILCTEPDGVLVEEIRLLVESGSRQSGWVACITWR